MAVDVPPDAPTVDRLLDVAAALFWEKGYAATTTREIATALGIQQASLYFHIASKEDLLYQVFVSSLKQFLADVPAAVEEVECPLERVQALIHAHVAMLLTHQKRNVTMFTELRALSRPHRAEVHALRERYAKFVRSNLQNAQAAGRIRAEIPATYLALALLNILNWTALWFRTGKELSADQVADIFVTLYLRGAATPLVTGRLTVPSLEPEPRKAAFRVRKRPSTAENATQKRLLTAAVSLFSRKGYMATTTREVAALLGMQKASLYNHIESKEDLLYLTCKSSLESIRADVETAIREIHDPLERTRVLICAHVESLLRDFEEHTTTLAEMHALSPGRLAQITALRKGYVDFVRSVLQDAQNAGALRPDIGAKYLCLSLMGLMDRVLVWYRRRGPLSPAQLGQLLAVIFLTGVAVPGEIP
jgi:AcrR family transcriptional regulator